MRSGSARSARSSIRATLRALFVGCLLLCTTSRAGFAAETRSKATPSAHPRATPSSAKPAPKPSIVPPNAVSATPLPPPEPQVPLAALRSSQAALLEATHALAAQADDQRHTRAEEESRHTASLIQLGLLGVGVLYTLFACLQWFAIRRQAQLLEAAVAENRKSSDAAIQNAMAAEKQAATLERTLAATEQAALAAKQSAETGRAALLLNLRALIELDGQVIERGTELIAQLTLLNSGPTAAIILEQGYYFWLRDRSEPYPPELPIEHVIKPLGERLETLDSAVGVLKIYADETASTVCGNASLDRWHAYVENRWVACLAAHIRYEDEGGRVHVTNFCGAWDRMKRRFVVLDEMPALYNYSK